MHRKLLLFFLLTSVFNATAQGDCQYDAEGNCIGRGKIKVITHKTSYGGKYISHARVGAWQLFNTDGIKKAEGQYKYENEFSERNGEWKYYSDENVLLFKRWYVNGRIQKTQFIDSGYYAHESDTLFILSDSMGNLKIEERKGKLNYRYTATPLQVLNGDPSLFANIEKKKALEEERIHWTDDDILRQYPAIHSTLGVRHWAVNSPQNLINNPDFEAMRDKMYLGQSSQIKPGDEHLAKFWSSANETPDIYKAEDNCYAGYRVYGVNYEVLRNELKAPLKAGATYCMQFKLKLKFENTHAVNGVSVTLSKNLMGFRIPSEAIKNGVVLQTHKDLPLACKERWMTISGSFTAAGGEKFIYIGNFTPDLDLKLFDIDNAGKKTYIDEIYYYIDDVVLIEQKEGTNCPCNVDGCELNYTTPDTIVKEPLLEEDNIYNKPKVGQTLVLRDIKFETAKWNLLDGSFNTLDSLVMLMQKFPGMKVEITGHTDNKGKAADNQLLSENRAISVASYLVDNGIDQERIETKGFGATQPTDSNATEAGRYNNRRVEFRILAL